MPKPKSAETFRIAVIGGGASAVLLAHALAKRATRKIALTIIERDSEVGPGLAYATQFAGHLLNVPARRMSADMDDSDHFLRWLGAGTDPEHFAPRGVYGRYLKDVLAQARTSNLNLAIDTISGDATALAHRGHWQIGIGGESLHAHATVLACGNAKPKPLFWQGTNQCAEIIHNDPWGLEALDHIPTIESVLLVGAGLTALDVALYLASRGHEGTITAISRHGLRPQAHIFPRLSTAWLSPPYPETLHGLLRAFHHVARAQGLQFRLDAAIDGLRPITSQLWQSLSEADRARFLRHLRTHWNVARHRIAPEIASQIEALEASGQLKYETGRINRLERDAEHARVHLHDGRVLIAGAIINCTGPLDDLARGENVLLAKLLQAGTVRTDPLKLSLDVDVQSRVIGGEGRPHETLFAIGPLTRGRFWEITAIPEIRVQADTVARKLVALAP